MIVEDNTGKTDSNTYVDIEYADNYFTSYGVEGWSSLTNSEKSILLVKATDYIDNIFDWNGKKKTQTQALNFPRENLFDKDGYEIKDVPKVLKDSVCEAVKILLTSSELFKSENQNGAVVSEHIGELSFTYDVAQKGKDTTLYESINTRLRGLYKDKSKKKIYSARVERKL